MGKLMYSYCIDLTIFQMKINMILEYIKEEWFQVKKSES